MDVVIAVEGPAAADELRSLQLWLIDDDDFRGLVRLHNTAPASGTMSGAIVDGLTIAVSSSLGTALATVLVTWLKTRVGKVQFRLTRPDGAMIEMTAEQVRGLDAEGAWRRVGQVADLLAAGPELRGPGAGTTAGSGEDHSSSAEDREPAAPTG